MKQQKLHRRFGEFYEAAKAAHLSCPKGRAIYLCNRLLNGGWPMFNDWKKFEVLAVLRSIRHETAEKWLKHWENGGSLKALRSREAQARVRKAWAENTRDKWVSGLSREEHARRDKELIEKAVKG